MGMAAALNLAKERGLFTSTFPFNSLCPTQFSLLLKKDDTFPTGLDPSGILEMKEEQSGRARDEDMWLAVPLPLATFFLMFP